MMSRGGTRLARSLTGHVAPRYFSTAVLRRPATAAGGEAGIGGVFRGGAAAALLNGNPAKASEEVMVAWMRFPVMGSRRMSTVAVGDDKQKEKDEKNGGGRTDSAVVSYWGVDPPKVSKEDGTEWKWQCFRPWETYKADLSIDLKKHHVPVTFLDKMAYWTVKALRFPTDIFFQEVWLSCDDVGDGGCGAGNGGRDVAPLQIPPAIRAQRGVDQGAAGRSGERENASDDVHGGFSAAVEEAIHSYTEFLKELDKGNIENVPAPAIALDYWRLPPGSTLRDVVLVVRADEAHHRDVNHFASDIHYQGQELKDSPAPIGYH
nr:ubiquinol oxidase 2, mitochondrial [Ipomoea batatas]